MSTFNSNIYDLYVNGFIKLDLSNRYLQDNNSLKELSKIDIPCQIDKSDKLINCLQHIIAKNNDLKIFPQILCSFLKLTNLDLSYNSILSIPQDIGLLNSLNFLNLSNNCITCLPDTLGRLKYLKHLNVSSNNLKSLTENLHHLVNLNYLNLSNNLLEYLPKKLPLNLTEVFIQNNIISFLPDNINQLKYLIFLNCSQNSLNKFNINFFSVPNLRTLLLNENELRSLCPEKFSHQGISSIRTLDLSNKIHWIPWNELPASETCKRRSNMFLGNWIREFPYAFFYPLGNLLELNMQKLKLSMLPEAICDLKLLKVLKLCDNRLYGLPENFGNLCNLENLQLSRNMIKFLPDSFCNLQNLICLDLSFNQIHELPTYFSSFTLLRKFDIYYNNLYEYPIFLNNLQLDFVDFSRNQFYFELDDLPASVLEAFKKSKGINDLPEKLDDYDDSSHDKSNEDEDFDNCQDKNFCDYNCIPDGDPALNLENSNQDNLEINDSVTYINEQRNEEDNWSVEDQVGPSTVEDFINHEGIVVNVDTNASNHSMADESLYLNSPNIFKSIEEDLIQVESLSGISKDTGCIFREKNNKVEVVSSVKIKTEQDMNNIRDSFLKEYDSSVSEDVLNNVKENFTDENKEITRCYPNENEGVTFKNDNIISSRINSRAVGSGSKTSERLKADFVDQFFYSGKSYKSLCNDNQLILNNTCTNEKDSILDNSHMVLPPHYNDPAELHSKSCNPSSPITYVDDAEIGQFDDI